MVGMPAAAALRAAASLDAMPPVPSRTRTVPRLAAMARSWARASGDRGPRRGRRAGRASYRPATSLRMTSRSASTSVAVSAERLSLSPNLSSSTATVSFSFTIGTTPSAEQGAQRVARVQVAAAVGEVVVREQDLRDRALVPPEGALVGRHQAGLADRGRGLAPSSLPRRPPRPGRPGGDGAGADDHDLPAGRRHARRSRRRARGCAPGAGRRRPPARCCRSSPRRAARGGAGAPCGRAGSATGSRCVSADRRRLGGGLGGCARRDTAAPIRRTSSRIPSPVAAETASSSMPRSAKRSRVTRRAARASRPGRACWRRRSAASRRARDWRARARG